jgi:hypothetical protein
MAQLVKAEQMAQLEQLAQLEQKDNRVYLEYRAQLGNVEKMERMV